MLDTHNMSQADRIIRAKVDLNKSNPFFSYILLNMNIEQTKTTDQIPTFAINKWGRLLWNAEFVAILNDQQLAAVLAHEAMHMAMLTFQRRNNRDSTIWNIATDLINNAILKEDNFNFPDGCVLPDNSGDYEFTGKGQKKYVIHNVLKKSAEDIYDELIDKAEEIKVFLGADSQGNYKGSFDHHEACKDGDENTTAEENANSEKWKKIATEAITQSRMSGINKNYIEKMIGELLNPEIDWRTKLFQFVTKELPADFTMRRPGRRFYTTGIYYPSILREKLEVLIAIDTSGSIGVAEYKKFMSECIGVAKAFDQISMRILWWSTEVTNDEIVDKTNCDDLVNYQFGSTGGTKMSCVAKYLESQQGNNMHQARVIIYLTDGRIENKPKVPETMAKLFVISKKGTDQAVKEYGQVTHLRGGE